ncbi:hypothetical protein HanHA300_Chr16g0611651 [Helianthus annuus]|nr:hypothetical protein HanHA300_Chr16g0611651 [Helianthus annuus]KAJ0460562.1 hypothetical protein HanHA89_Chr16g0662241 [Helianthus annuus]
MSSTRVASNNGCFRRTHVRSASPRLQNERFKRRFLLKITITSSYWIGSRIMKVETCRKKKLNNAAQSHPLVAHLHLNQAFTLCRGYFAKETTHLRLCTDYTIACLHKQRNGLPLKNLQLMGNRMLMTGSCTHKRLKFCSLHYKQHHDRLMTNYY